MDEEVDLMNTQTYPIVCSEGKERKGKERKEGRKEGENNFFSI